MLKPSRLESGKARYLAQSCCYRARSVALAALASVVIALSVIPTALLYLLPWTRRLSSEFFLHIHTIFCFMGDHLAYAFLSHPKRSTLVTSKPFDHAQTDFKVNLALLKEAYHATSDPFLRNKLKFLARNYLDKSAPYAFPEMQLISPKLTHGLRYGYHSSFLYHRMDPDQLLEIGRRVASDLPLVEKAPYFPCGASEVHEFFPIYFTTMTDIDRETIKGALKDHLIACDKGALSMRMPKGLFFDLSSRLDCSAGADPVTLQEGISQFKADLTAEYAEVVKELVGDPEVGEFVKAHSKDLQKYLCANSTAVSCTKRSRICGGVKILPIFHDFTKTTVEDAHPELLSSFVNSGIVLNRLETRWAQPSIFDEDLTTYAISGANAIIYRNLDGIKGFDTSSLALRPDIEVMLAGTIKLLQGINREVSEEKWDELNADPGSRLALQSSICKIHNALTMAMMHGRCGNSRMVNESLEIVHAEMTTLLVLTEVLTSCVNATSTLKGHCECVPEKYHAHMGMGVARTSMNIVSGVLIAGREIKPDFKVAYCPGLYYEQVRGDMTPVADATEGADLYLTQFSPNLDVSVDTTHYKPVDVISDIDALLERNGPDRPLTVVLDTTIDFINSSRVNKVITRFESQIDSGALNLVVMRSGQKTDMFGMDNYYGGLVYIVNNRDLKWRPYDRIFWKDAHAADPVSTQWFVLSHKYAFAEMERYREILFENSRRALDLVPKKLLPRGRGRSQSIRVNTVSRDMAATFLDIKICGLFHRIRGFLLLLRFYYLGLKHGVKGHSRPSFGFYHLNASFIYSPDGDNCANIRINPGLSPKHRLVVQEFLGDIARCV